MCTRIQIWKLSSVKARRPLTQTDQTPSSVLTLSCTDRSPGGVAPPPPVVSSSITEWQQGLPSTLVEDWRGGTKGLAPLAVKKLSHSVDRCWIGECLMQPACKVKGLVLK